WLHDGKECDHWPATGSPMPCRIPATKLKFVTLQLNASGKTKEARLDAAIALLEKAADAEGPGVYLLPEYSLYPNVDASSVVANQEKIPGPMTERFAAIATKRNLWVGVGMSETSADPKKPYNAIALIGPHGQIHRYHKTHLFEPGIGGRFRETQLFTPGEALDVFDIEGWRMGIMVCFDGNFPEVPRVLALKGAQVILYSNGRNLVGAEAEVASASNAALVVVSNYVGDSGLEQAQGTSRLIVPPFGTVVASVKGEQEGWAAKEFTYDEVTRWRNMEVVGRAPVIDPRSRRPELYGVITEKE
ncbi:MAG: carbon-nitrogen hydrolase family protein, partial [Planctomycetota bacterium]|nr:carbon-nitrogen hydrolase family protein [Planctomycetota bacterium]